MAVPAARVVAAALMVGLLPVGPFIAQDLLGQDESGMGEMADRRMWSASFADGWRAAGMAQLFPVVTFGAPSVENSEISKTAWYVTQPAMMLNIETPGQRWTLRTTLNLEGVTLDDGELTYGAWGEGFIDKRHPHNLLHELMLTLNLWDLGGGNLSLSAGKGFAPYGTDDPMARPGLKYPTNHHLSQILERWTINGLYLRGGWGVEAGIFGGEEPDGPYDFDNIRSFADSWSIRLSRRWGSGSGPASAWEASGSYARVAEGHIGITETTELWNVALRRGEQPEWGLEAALWEASFGRQEHGDQFFSVLTELWFDWSAYAPYLRFEYSSRPEYVRELGTGASGFFRYEHDADPFGSTRWLTSTVAQAFEVTGYPISLRPFVEVQHFRVWSDRGGLDPVLLFGDDSFWGFNLGARIFVGGSPMRMGAYGALDPITTMVRMETMGSSGQR